MQLFKVMDNGEVHEIKDDRPIKEILQSTESYILNDDDRRVVYLWKGSKCSVRSKFIGANKLQEVRGQVGLHYKSISMDEDEMQKYPDFMEAIEQPPGEGFAREIREEMELKFEVGGGPVKPRTYKDIMGNAYNDSIEQTGPLYKGEDSLGDMGSSQKKVSKEDLDEILSVFDEEGIPEGYEREMIIMGDTAYSVAEKVQTFLGKKQVEKVLEPISSLPEGIFFAEGYVPRVLVKNQTVVAVEFLKKKE